MVHVRKTAIDGNGFPMSLSHAFEFGLIHDWKHGGG